LKLGTAADSDIFRKQIDEKLSKADQLMKKLGPDLDEFKNMQVTYEREVSAY
jgi:hypothetical protein